MDSTQNIRHACSPTEQVIARKVTPGSMRDPVRLIVALVLLVWEPRLMFLNIAAYCILLSWGSKLHQAFDDGTKFREQKQQEFVAVRAGYVRNNVITSEKRVTSNEPECGAVLHELHEIVPESGVDQPSEIGPKRSARREKVTNRNLEKELRQTKTILAGEENLSKTGLNAEDSGSLVKALSCHDKTDCVSTPRKPSWNSVSADNIDIELQSAVRQDVEMKDKNLEQNDSVVSGQQEGFGDGETSRSLSTILKDDVGAARLHVELPPFETPRRHFTTQLEVSGYLGDLQVAAVLDSGSSFDIISEELALRLHLRVDTSKAREFYLPNGRRGAFVGTVSLVWSFGGEAEKYARMFYVLKNCVHPIMLGRQFLDLTKMLSTNAHLVKEGFIEKFSDTSQKSLLVDTPSQKAISRERTLGLINGYPIGGLADTCSDFTIIKLSAAQQIGLTILEDDAFKKEVQFVDGSTEFTTGLIQNARWCFSASFADRDTHLTDVHVMDNIPYAFILDKWLFWDNRAFLEYRECFIDIVHCGIKSQGFVCLITEKKQNRLRDIFRPARSLDPSLNTQASNPDAESREEARLRTENRDRIASMRPELREAAQRAEEQRVRQWEAAHANTDNSAAPTTNP